MTGVNDIEGLANVKVIGIGGGGCNAVARMLSEEIPGVDFLCVNTDAQALMRSEAPTRIRIGNQISRGLGVGGNPEKGRQAAEESRDEVAATLKGADMVFLAAGMGGGTGTGASPVIAELARSEGALTVAVVTRPFEWEGAHRRNRAEEGINRLREKVDTLLVIPNDALVQVCDRKVTITNAFKLADEVLRRAILAIAELITVPGDINLDFADVRAVMSNAGSAMMGVGWGKGDNRATDAARAAISNPLLDVSIEGATGVLFNITGGADLTLSEVDAAADIISKAVDANADIFFGMATDNKMESEVKITLIATGFPSEQSTEMADPGTIGRLMQDRGSEPAVSEEELDVPPFLRRPPQPRPNPEAVPQITQKLPIGF
ncbi:MAG: cell division protein FtsZ [Chloroflexi bacterium]|nr:cell division protein FtsZ [Chloroflexota bacterium]